MKTRRSGFTLVEMATVFLILAAAAAVALPAFLRLAQEDDLQEATRVVEGLFRIARDSAIQAGMPVTVVVDSVTGFVWLDAPRPLEQALSSAAAEALGVVGVLDDPMFVADTTTAEIEHFGTVLPIPPTVQMSVPAARTRFTFAPDGQAFTESLTLESVLGTRLITLDPWTGDVIVR